MSLLNYSNNEIFIKQPPPPVCARSEAARPERDVDLCSPNVCLLRDYECTK